MRGSLVIVTAIGFVCLALAGCQSNNGSSSDGKAAQGMGSASRVHLLNTSAKPANCDDGSCCDDSK